MEEAESAPVPRATMVGLRLGSATMAEMIVEMRMEAVESAQVPRATKGGLGVDWATMVEKIVEVVRGALAVAAAAAVATARLVPQ